MTEKKREEYVVRIGPLLRKAIDLQAERVTKITYDVCNTSDYEAGEIIAKKVLKMI